MKYVYVGEELLLTTYGGDGDGCDCPEDMIWERDLRVIFFAGVKAGRMTKNNSEIEALNEEKESQTKKE